MERETRTLAVWHDEDPQELIERVCFVLIEMGIKMKVSESQEGCTIYSLTHAERLNDKEKDS